MATDQMYCMEAKQLLNWLLRDLKKGFALGIPESLFFRPGNADPFRMERYGKILETPVGVAAGPHAQMAHNIVAAWLCGARYMELKTVQILDSITVTKPCIDMTDEGYNCEWSQELNLEASFREYLKAFVLIHVLHDHLGFSGSPGMLFNMSAGYSMEGILSPPMQRFLDRMQYCPEEVAELTRELAPLYPRVMKLAIPGYLSDNLTISCMHGCPPEEVEKIALYFIRERRLHTTLKLNPTLLGPVHVRGLVNDILGYDAIVPDLAFEHDLSYGATMGILNTCLPEAAKAGVRFGVKLTNTLETLNTTKSLPGNEKMVYMSGKPLHPIAVSLAAMLQKNFDGRLDISFCAGADALNVADTIACGLAPVTVCSDLLKPGGYGRLAQYLVNIRAAMEESGAGTITEFIRNRAGDDTEANAVLCNLDAYAASLVLSGARYARSARIMRPGARTHGVKTERPLPVLDCAAAPCVSACPASQDIPAYMEHAANGNMDEALSVILATNPFPSVLGKICNQICKNACIRVHYDEPLHIRAVKGCAAANGSASLKPSTPNGRAIAIAGASPAGLSCAYFLALAGCRVAVYEADGKPGGIMNKLVREKDSVERDIKAILDLGVTLHTGSRLDGGAMTEMAACHDAVYAATDGDLVSDGPEQANVFRLPPLAGKRSLSLVESVGEGRRAAHKLLAFLSLIPGQPMAPARSTLNVAEICRRQAFREPSPGNVNAASPPSAAKEAARCLQCSRYCGVCVSVCPNRANMALFSTERSWPVQEAVCVGEDTHVRTLDVKTLRQTWQVVNIGDFCNECGNCETFCPSSCAPYKSKQRVHFSQASFNADRNGIIHLDDGTFSGKRENEAWSLHLENEGWVYEDDRLTAVLNVETLAAKHVALKKGCMHASLGDAAQAAIFCDLICDAMPSARVPRRPYEHLRA